MYDSQRGWGFELENGVLAWFKQAFVWFESQLDMYSTTYFLFDSSILIIQIMMVEAKFWEMPQFFIRLKEWDDSNQILNP